MTSQTLPTRRQPDCQLAFHVERSPYFLLVTFRGEASFDQAEGISPQLLRPLLEAYSLVVLNLAELTFLSSLAVDALLELRRVLWQRGVEVRLTNVPSQIWLTLELAGLGQLFESIDLEAPPRLAASAGA
jgi:anti-anti-sigma factor